MISRYSRPAMAAIWSEEFRWKTILDIEIRAAEAYAKTPADRRAVRALKSKAKIDIPRILEIEKTTKHDVIAFLTQVEEKAGSAAKVLHRGLTSSDVLDTALAIQMCSAMDLLIPGLEGLMGTVRRLAWKHADTPMMGRSHGVHGEPITFGFKVAGWYTELARNLGRLRNARREVAFGKLSGAMGNFAHVDPAVEAKVCRGLGLSPEPAATQVVPRDRHAVYFTALALSGAALERIATEIRHLQRTEVLEVEEPFTSGQKGSSAMPHKRNPVGTENICGLARLLRGYVTPALENIALWHERDISHSSVERVALPDASILLDYILARMEGILAGLQVYPERMRTNMDRTAEIVCSQRLAVALSRSGMAKQEAYELVQGHALRAWTEGLPFRAAISADRRISGRMTAAELAEVFNLQAFFRNTKTILRRALGAGNG